MLALHGLMLVALAPAWVDPEEPAAAAPTLNVRSVPAPSLPAAVELAPTPNVAPAQAPPKVARPPMPPKPAASAVPAPPPEPVAEASASAVTNEPPPTPAIDLPVYATRLPPPGTWRYQLTRGVASGDALLSWRPDEQQRYELKLEGFVAGISVLDWVSSGAIDNAGIAPDRFVIRRRGRDSQAANFQRSAGKITFSGPTHEVPLVAGVQDRLSWMLQLPAVIEAAPQRFGAGTSVVLMVVGVGHESSFSARPAP